MNQKIWIIGLKLSVILANLTWRRLIGFAVQQPESQEKLGETDFLLVLFEDMFKSSLTVDEGEQAEA